MKNIRLFTVIFLSGIILMTSCKKKKDAAVISTPPPAISHPISSSSPLCGNVKGTMLTGSTYSVSCDVTILPNDTLYVQNGVTINVGNNATFFILGTIISEGTQASPIFFTVANNPAPGKWGGFQCDSAKYVSFKWTHLEYTGGPDQTAAPRRTIRINKPMTFIFQDCWVKLGLDDGLRIEGGATISILRNTFEGGCCSTDGEAINIKSGCHGDIAYNMVWSQAGSGIKIETSSTILFPKTSVNVYNNTVVNSGFRRGAGEPGCGLFCDLFGSGNFYNNIMVNVYNGINFGKSADTLNVHYGNNLLYCTVDSIRPLFYVPGSFGHPQVTDIISTGTGVNDPKFVHLDLNVSNTTNLNDLHLQAGSPAINKGNPLYNVDLGAYPSNGSGNKH
jgi:hypothetical protein